MSLIRLLLVDDDDEDHLILRDLLRSGRGRYDIDSANTLDQARSLLSEHGYDIVFVDYRLGPDSGLELLTDSNRTSWQAPFVLLTGFDDDELDEQAAQAGAADYLPKRGLTTAALERSIRYVLARQETVRAAQTSEERFRAVIEQASDAIIVAAGPVYDNVIHWNQAAEHMFGLQRHEATRLGLRASLNLPDGPTLTEGRIEVEASTYQGRPLVLDMSIATWSVDHDPQACLIIRDITRQHAAQQALHERATTDELTGLANRSSFIDAARQLASTTERADQFAILYLDLDQFKTINDTLGHGAGDAILKEAANRLRGQIRDHDLAARLGGDEFAVLITGAPTPSTIELIAHRCLAALRAPYLIESRLCHLGASIGAAQILTGETAEDLIDRADQAMYTAKRHGRNQIVYSGQG